MEIARERFLDDTRQYHLTLSLRSRTTAMHTVLTDLTGDEREQVSQVLSRALDELTQILRGRAPHRVPSAPAPTELD